MEKTIKAKFSKGMLELSEKLELEEGSEMLITIKELPGENRFKKAAGSWESLVD